MYYGNSEAITASSGTNTFLGYHGASSSNFQDTPTIDPTNTIYEGYVYITASVGHNHEWGLRYLDSDITTIQSYEDGNARHAYTYKDSVGASINETPAFTENTWIRLKIINSASVVHYFVDGNEIASGATINIPIRTLALHQHLHVGSAQQAWSFVRKYTATEPTPSFGAEQNN
jgi:hypothetical protein